MENKEVCSRVRWKTRRLMAWISLFALIGIAAGSFLLPENMDKSTSVLNTLIFAFGGIVTGYLGFATLDDKWHKKPDPGAGT